MSYSPLSHKRVGHDLATKQQQQRKERTGNGKREIEMCTKHIKILATLLYKQRNKNKKKII